ncbi:disease resistance protein TAO1-like [Gossypium australe]|uniref:Disease resistance protein TAO1-like n=1 Tax=Gossypium australe TaxID=47621 RepID=A0A5B6VU19_9ROSI|nr:disease resistance protein TAO1-like [Gossypium australe]
MQKVLSLFQYGFPDFQILGIWGMGGTGKTTLAEAIFYHVLDGFQSYFFLANVRESADQGTLFQLRQKLFSTILEDENLDISTPTIIPSFVKDRLSRKKVLVVCDDVSKSSQLEYLFGGNNRLGPGSRVIVTTRDKQLLIQYGIDLIYKVEELDRDESAQLFCQCAFKSDHPTEYQLELSEMVLSFANGSPLAIKIFGSSLYGKDKNYQESAVKELKQIPNPDILKLLRSSFDGLNPVEKDICLDIACFLKGENLDFVRRIMDASYDSAHSSIENLIDKSLISVSQHKIAMHDLLQQMGRDIIYNESPLEPERRSRLCLPNDIYNVLTENSVRALFISFTYVTITFGTKTLKAILLDMSKIPKLELKAEAFVKMRKLKFLKFYLPYSFERVQNMFTAIGGRPVKQKHLHGLSLLWRLDLSESNLENLPTTIKQFPLLEELILRKCKRLKSLPELPPSLVYLDAHDCTSLEDVSSIKKVFEQALFCEDGPKRWLKLIFTDCFQLNEKCTGNDTSVEEVSSIKKLLKQAVFCKSLGSLFTYCFQLDQKGVSSAETPKLEMPFEQLVTVLKDYHQAPPESKKGTRIVRINFPCFVASVVVSFPDSYNGMEFGIRCKCHLKSCNGDSHYLSCYVSGGFESGLSDHLFLLYGGEEVWGFVKSEASNKRFYNEASFSFYLDLDKRIRSECKVKQCGIHLLFAN